MENPKLSSLLLVIFSAITALVALYINVGQGLCIQYSLVSALALMGWLRFSYKQIPSQNTIIPPFIMSIVLVLLLTTFRYASDFS